MCGYPVVITMTGNIIAFIIWSIVGIIIITLGLSAFFAKKEVGFWANASRFAVTDVKKYNNALGKLFVGYGKVFILLGLPMLTGQNSPWIILSIGGIVLESIVAMVIYTVMIEKKYMK